MATTSEDFVDSTIANLKIIGMVPKNGKLCVRKGQLCIDNQRAQGLRRWLNGDSREFTLVHAKNTVVSSIKIARCILLNNSTDTTSTWTLRRILREMELCEQGLNNLKTTTYSDDSVMVAHLDVIIERQVANRNEILSFFQRHNLQVTEEQSGDE
jgi:hypothetical protein